MSVGFRKEVVNDVLKSRDYQDLDIVGLVHQLNKDIMGGATAENASSVTMFYMLAPVLCKYFWEDTYLKMVTWINKCPEIDIGFKLQTEYQTSKATSSLPLPWAE